MNLEYKQANKERVKRNPFVLFIEIIFEVNTDKIIINISGWNNFIISMIYIK